MKLRHLALTCAAASALAIAAPTFAQANNTNSRIAPAEWMTEWARERDQAPRGDVKVEERTPNVNQRSSDSAPLATPAPDTPAPVMTPSDTKPEEAKK